MEEKNLYMNLKNKYMEYSSIFLKCHIQFEEIKKKNLSQEWHVEIC